MGDQFNDLEMIAAAGHGVAMATAPAGVQAVARYIAPPVTDEGAAQVIEALVLSGRAAPRNVSLLAAGGVARDEARVVPDDAAGGRWRSRRSIAARSWRCRPTRSTGSGSRSMRAGGLERLFAAKHRPLDRGIVLLLADHRQAEEVGELDAAAHVLAAAFWPGGLTLVVPQRPDAGSRPR